jgi:hypothetical protein
MRHLQVISKDEFRAWYLLQREMPAKLTTQGIMISQENMSKAIQVLEQAGITYNND